MGIINQPIKSSLPNNNQNAINRFNRPNASNIDAVEGPPAQQGQQLLMN